MTRQKAKVKKQKIKTIILLVSFFNFSFFIFNFSFAQQPVFVKKSDKVEIIGGKKYYLHLVEKGQTLYSIAKTYGTTVDIVLSNNPDAIDGLKAGDTLKIPFATSASEKKTHPFPADTVRAKKETPDPKLLNAIQKNDSISISFPPGTVKENQHVNAVVFLPLSLKTVESIDPWKIITGSENFPERSRIGVEFYEGVKLAFDSLRKNGFSGKLFIYDSYIDSASYVKLLKKPEFKETNLIIGPLHGKEFSVVSKFANGKNIPIVSPVLQNNNILLGKPAVIKVMPSQVTQSEALAKYVLENFKGENILLFNSANSKDKPNLNAFKKTANPVLTNAKSDSVREVTFSTLKTFISKTKTNIIVIPSANESFVAEAVNKLYRMKLERQDSIIVFGLNNWREMESLNFTYLNTLCTHFAVNAFIDYENPQTKQFILKFRNEFKTEPGTYSFLGFDIAWYFLSAAKKYGNRFTDFLPEEKHAGIQTHFDFYRPEKNNGLENTGIAIVKMDNYRYVRVK